MTDSELFEAISLSIADRPSKSGPQTEISSKVWIKDWRTMRYLPRNWATPEGVEILREKMVAEAAICKCIVVFVPGCDKWSIRANGDKPTYWSIHVGPQQLCRAWIEAYAKWKGIL